MTEPETTETEGHVDIPADLSTLTVPQLREVADVVRLDVPKSAPKAALVEAIEDYRTRVQETIAARLPEVEAEEVEETEEPPADVAEAESTALALREEPVVAVPALLPSEAEFDAMLAIAARIAGTQMVPTAYRGKPDDVLAAILTGREMGLGPMQSLRDIYVVDGKPSLSANLLLARLREGGVVVLESQSDNDHARIRAQRRDTGEIAEVEWTMEDAKKITYRTKGGTKPLVSKDNWTNYPADMLWARAVGRLARRLGPDLIGAAMPYTSEEVQDWDSDAPADSGDRAPYGSDKQTGTWLVPKDWRELSLRLSSDTVLADDAGAWMEELAEKAYGRSTFRDVVGGGDPVSPERRRDLFQRLCAVLRTLEDEGAPNGVSLLPDPRTTILQAIYEAFDKTVVLDGPQWALNGDEAERGMPAREAVVEGPQAAATAPAAETPTQTSQAESEPQNAAEAPPEPAAAEPSDDVDEIKF